MAGFGALAFPPFSRVPAPPKRKGGGVFSYKVVGILGVEDLLRRSGGKRRAEDIVQGEMPDEIVGLALAQFSQEGWRLHTILPLNTDVRRGNSGYLAIFEKET